MSASHRFEAAARAEYLGTLRFYIAESGSTEVARRFATAIRSAISLICASPEMWRVIEPFAMRRYVLQRFPFVIYFGFEPAKNLVTIYAVMHTSRLPGYWHGR